MSSELLLKAAGLGKVYLGAQRPFATLRHALFGSALSEVDQYPVLFDIDLEVRRGETVGILGRNGAGKTTLLGLLGNVIQPTSGTIERQGRIATLLGLTAGFNPNFSGRENAYLFCSIQGLTREEAEQRIDAIARFAALGRYFELPLHSYSSGMQSRLAFACAVHVDADLIIIDETLAVGDANFRMKCYERIRRMKEEGQTFLLVSHSQNLVANFCSRAVVLEGGHKIFDGPTLEAVEVYKQVRTNAMGDGDLRVGVGADDSSSKLAGEVTLEGMALCESDGEAARVAALTGFLVARECVENVTVNFGISSNQGIVVCAVDGYSAGMLVPKMKPGDSLPIRMQFAKRLLPGRYFVSAIVHSLVGEVAKPLSLYPNFLSFDIGGDPGMTGLADLDMKISVRQPTSAA